MKNKKGQALTELAIFGSILLFCVSMLIQYGLGANYQQQVEMEAFRKAQKIAFYKSGPNAATSLTLLKDKPLPDSRDQWGFAERYPVLGGGSVTWDSQLSSQYVKEFNDTPQEKDLPALYFEVDKAETIPSEARAEVPPGARERGVFGFWTARAERRACPNEILVVFENPDHQPREYSVQIVSKGQIKVMLIDDPNNKNSKSLMYPFFRDNGGLKRRITLADLDMGLGDGKLEYIIAANKDGAGKIKDLLYIQSHHPARVTRSTIAGAIQIDTDYTGAPPEDLTRVEERQGLIGDFQKDIRYNVAQGIGPAKTKIIKTENKGKVSSRTELWAKQKITHKVRLNNAPQGQAIEIPADFFVYNDNLYNWK